MKRKLKVGLVQMNWTVGDIVGNVELMIEKLKTGREEGVELMAFPEMAIIGYPAQDLLYYEEIIESNLKACEEIEEHTRGYLGVIVGYCDWWEGFLKGRGKGKGEMKYRIRQRLQNGYRLYRDGKQVGQGAKICLANEGVLDDCRYFVPGDSVEVHDIGGVKVGVEICEDVWYRHDEDRPRTMCALKPSEELRKQGAELIVVINASPYHVGKEEEREELITSEAKHYGVYILYVNGYGGNDKVIFDGNSLISDGKGRIVCRGKSFEEDLLIYEIELNGSFSGEGNEGIGGNKGNKGIEGFGILKGLEREGLRSERQYGALCLGVRDYHRKNRIGGGSVIGVSGGIDSAVCLGLDVGAIGSENVLGLILPSRYTKAESMRDAVGLCKNFGVRYEVIELEREVCGEWEGVMEWKYRRYREVWGEPMRKEVFENQQSMERMSILRGISKEEDRIITGTSNKSELGVGYGTICGDLQADLLTIGDLYKTEVIELAKYINRLYGKEMISKNIIKKIPSAELSESQVDPFDYKRLDKFIKLKIENYLSNNDLLIYNLDGYEFSKCEIKIYNNLIEKNEHKRFQSSYILKVSPVAFGEDRRMNTSKNIHVKPLSE